MGAERAHPPLDLLRGALLAAMYLGLLLLFVVPPVSDFLRLAPPAPGTLAWILGVSAAGSLAVELAFRWSRRRETGELAQGS